MAASRPVLALLISAALPAFAQNANPPDAKPEPPKGGPEHGEHGPGPGFGAPGGPGDAGKPPFPNRGDRPGGGPPPPDGPRPEGWPDNKGGGHQDWGHHGPPPGAPFGNLPPDADRERGMRELQKLTEEQRKQIWRAVIAVMNLSPEKQAELIGNEEERRKKIKEQIEQVMKEIGVPIADNMKRAFFREYFEGRRAIEGDILKEMELLRAKKLAELKERLKTKFGAEAPETPKLAPAPDPK